MRTVVSARWYALLSTLLLAACAWFQPPAVRAAEVERVQCDARGSADRDAELLRSVTVLGVRPFTTFVRTGNNNSEDRVKGARLLLRPPAGVSADTLTRLLQCHSARVLLGRISPTAVPDDPYWLAEADGWLDIDVRPKDGNYEVTLSTNSIKGGIGILGRANRYADDHMLAGGPMR